MLQDAFFWLAVGLVAIVAIAGLKLLAHLIPSHSVQALASSL